MTDWPAINAEAGAVPGGVPWVAGMRMADGRILCEVDDEGRLSAFYGHRKRRVPPAPDMSDAGTRGHLRAALGNPDIYAARNRSGDMVARVLRLNNQTGQWVQGVGVGSTRDEAEARALIAYARANGGWVVEP